MRTLIEFGCEGETLVGTLDAAEGARAGILIVSGGNEIRCGAHRGMSLVAARLARAGVAVFRYDRRGIGDSSGENRGFEASAPDMAAAARAFRERAALRHLVAFGNCDAATAIALFHAGAGIDSLLLSNPWTGGSTDELPAAAAIRSRYAERLRDPRQWLRLLRGGVDLRKLASGLRKLAQAGSEDRDLVDRMAAALTGAAATILLAERDNSAIAFRDAWRTCRHAPSLPMLSLDSASHSYAGRDASDWLYERLYEAAAYSAA